LRRSARRCGKPALVEPPGLEPRFHEAVQGRAGLELVEEAWLVDAVERPYTLIPLSTTHGEMTRRKSRSPTPAIRCTGAAWRCFPPARAPTVWAISSWPTAPPWCCGVLRRRPVWSWRQSPNRCLNLPRMPSPSSLLGRSNAQCYALQPPPTLAPTLPHVAHASPRRPHGALPGGDRCTTPS
jgi:hypothetical protein